MPTAVQPKSASTPHVDTSNATLLPRDSNQALGIGRFAVDFMSAKVGRPAPAVFERTLMFHTDSVLCGLSAIALNTNAPRILRTEALEYPKSAGGTPIFGARAKVAPE